MHSLSPQKHSKFQWLAWLDYIFMCCPPGHGNCWDSAAVNCRCRWAAPASPRDFCPPSRAACSCCLCQPVKVNGPYFRSQYFQRPVSWDTGHACESTRNFLLPRNTTRVGRTDKVSLTGHWTTEAGYWFWDKNWSGLPRTAFSIYADPGPNVLRVEQDVRNFEITLQKVFLHILQKVWNKLYNNEAESTGNPVPQEIPVTVHKYLCYHFPPSTCRMYV